MVVNVVSGKTVVRLLVRLTVWIRIEVCVVARCCSPVVVSELVEVLITADEMIAAMNTTTAMAMVLKVANYLFPFSYASELVMLCQSFKI